MLDRLRERLQRRAVESLSDAARHAGRDDVADQIDHAMNQDSGALPRADIIAALLPFIIALLGGGTLDWSAALQAILALFQKKSIKPA